MTTSAAPFAWDRWHLRLAERGDAPLCLALANTRHWRHGAAPLEQLNNIDDVIAFARAEALIDAAALEHLAEHAARHPRVAQSEHAALVRLREAIYRLFAAKAMGSHVPDEDFGVVAASFDGTLTGLTLQLRPEALRVSPRHADHGLDCIRMQCALSAAALLTGPHGGRVKQCADDRGCGRLFVDLTRNGSRRFCLSSECGNRARQAAFRARHAQRAAASSAG